MTRAVCVAISTCAGGTPRRRERPFRLSSGRDARRLSIRKAPERGWHPRGEAGLLVRGHDEGPGGGEGRADLADVVAFGGVPGAVDLAAEEALEVRADAFARVGVALADAAAEGDGVDAAPELDGVGAEVLAAALDEDVAREPRVRVARLGRGLDLRTEDASVFRKEGRKTPAGRGDVAHVRRDVREPEEARLLVEERVDLVGLLALVREEGEDARVDVAGARAHDEALEGREAHRRVDGLAVADAAHRRAAAEVEEDRVHRRDGLAQGPRDLLEHEGVARAVEAVAAHAEVLVQILGQRVAVGLGRHRRRVERRVRHRDLRTENT